MPPTYERDGDTVPLSNETPDPGECVHQRLFESLVHHLIEKGVFTKNDALSVVQAVAQVTRGALQEDQAPSARAHADLMMLQRMYSSFEAVADRPGMAQIDGENVHRLRPPLHGDRPEFPRDD